MNDYPSNVKQKLNSIISDMSEHHWLFSNNPGHNFMRQHQGKLSFYDTMRLIIGIALSLPILATIGLMVGLGYWNDWTNGLYYISDTKLYSLQQFLKSIIDNINTLATMATSADAAAAVAKMPGTSIRMAMAVIGVIPIMVLYPFFQKAFIAGISLGGVKE